MRSVLGLVLLLFGTLASSTTPLLDLNLDHASSPSPAAAAIVNNSISVDCDKPQSYHPGFPNACSFIRSHPDDCASGGAIPYAEIFFCRFAAFAWLGHLLLGIWLASLFYMLGNTAADYFCCSLQKLSGLLHLPPTVAGVTLLPLGNGAPDVFASIAAFVGAGAGEVGLNSVLGGAVFVTSIVAGLVYVITAGRSTPSSPTLQLDRQCFIRDVCFFLATLFVLTIILYVGKISFWGAVAFVSIYLVYAVTVAASEVIKKQASKLRWYPMQAVVESEIDEEGSWYTPLLDPDSNGTPTSNPIEITLPQWRWASHVAIYAHQQPIEEAVPRPLWGWNEQDDEEPLRLHRWRALLLKAFKIVIDWPLTLPRQLTIPLVEEKRWSRPIAVTSAAMAPVLLGFLLGSGVSSSYVYLLGLGTGAVLGLVAFFVTVPDHPPRTFVFPWVAGGFLMSIVWFYMIAKELVAVLVSLGMILEIDPSLLGLTVLAWGNSMGDLMANIAMAIGGGDGVQVAVSGCYAGPMFNTLVGLGISLLLASLKVYPAAFVVPSDPSLYYTIGFLVVGLLWTLVVLPASRMQPSRVLGIGLLVLYSSFLALRVFQTFGAGQ